MFQRFMRICSMILVIVLLVNMLPASVLGAALRDALAAEPQEQLTAEQTSGQETAAEVTILGELTDKRTEYTKQYLLSDGTFMAAVYADAVHYENNGAWEEIDNTLKSVAGAYTTTAGDWTVSFPQQLSSAKNITITKDGYTLSFGMAGRLNQSSGAVVASTNAVGGTAETFAVASAQTSLAMKQPVDLSEAKAAAKFEQLVQDKLYSKLSYANVYANTDIVYDLQSNKVKESVILSQYDSTLRGYRYTLNTGGMIPVLDETGHIEFYDPDMENIVMTMPAPFLEDANGAYNDDIQVTLTGSGSTYTLTYLLPRQWLADSARAYPVVLDPVVSAGTGVNNIADQTVFSIGSKSYTWIVVECGYDVNMGKERFFMAFTDLPDLTSADVIVDATVSLYKPYSSSNPFYVGVHSVANTWTSSTITWANMPNTGTTATDSLTVTSPGWYNWNVTSLAQNWYATGINTGMMFKASDAVEAAAQNSWSQFYSSDKGSYSPTLTIEYRTVNNISVGDLIDIDISESGEKEYFSFTPATTGFYTLESFGDDGDPYVWLYNTNMELLETGDDTDDDSNFRLTYHLLAGHEYNIVAGCFSTTVGTYSLYLYSPLSPDSLSMTSISLDAEKSVKNNIALESVYYKFVPQVTGEYLFYSTNASYDPKLYLYNSNNSLIDDDDDAAGNSNFRIAANLTAGQTYYLAASHYSTRTGTYTLNVLLAPNIPSDVYYLRNEGTDLFLDIHGPNAQEWVHQWSYSRGAQSRWSIVKQSDGYYTIQSKYGNQYYVGISSEETEEDNIKLFSSISDSTRWKIYAKSTGELFIEHKRATGMVLYSPNSSIGTELRLEWMSSSVENRNKWKIETQSSTPLEGQQRSNWCWVTASRMLVNHYLDVPSERSQAAAVTIIKGSAVNDGGTYDEKIKADNYYSSGLVNQNSLGIVGNFGSIYSPEMIRRYLNDGHILHITRGWYNEDNLRDDGHSYTLVGYTTRFNNGELQYRYLIYDPWPKNPPDNWTAPIVTEGQFYESSYEWICNGKNRLAGDPTRDNGIWEGFIVVQTVYSSFRIEAFWN